MSRFALCHVTHWAPLWTTFYGVSRVTDTRRVRCNCNEKYLSNVRVQVPSRALCYRWYCNDSRRGNRCVTHSVTHPPIGAWMSTYPTREEIARAIYDADATLYPNPLLASDESMNPLGETWEESEQDERDAYFANADAILALFPPIETIEAAVRARYPTREVIAAWIEGDDSANYWLSEADDILALFP